MCMRRGWGRGGCKGKQRQLGTNALRDLATDTVTDRETEMETEIASQLSVGESSVRE